MAFPVRRHGWLVASVAVGAALFAAVVYLAVTPSAPPRRHPRPGMDEAHPAFGWFHAPNTTLTGLVRINSKGLRGREYSYERRPDTYRILILGDGYTSAYEFHLEQVWHQRVEEGLNHRGASGAPWRVEVIAAAVPGWSTDQQFLYYRHEGYRYDPSLVIVAFALDDLYENSPDLFNPALKLRKPYFVVGATGPELRNFPYVNRSPSLLSAVAGQAVKKTVGFLKESVGHARSVVGPRRQSGPSQPPGCQSSTDSAFVKRDYTIDQPPRYWTAWRLTRLLLRELSAEVNRRGRRLAVIYIPEELQVSQEAWDAALACARRGEPVRWDRDLPNRTLRGILWQERIPYLDLTPGLRQRARRSAQGMHLPHTHFNLGGHQEAAKQVEIWLSSQGLAP